MKTYENIHFGIGIATFYRKNGKSYSYLKKCIESYEKQIYKNFTIYLIGDDIDNEEYYNQINDIIKKSSCKIKFYNNKENNERKYIPNSVNLWNVAGANSINLSIKQMENDNITYYVHTDDDVIYTSEHLFNIAYGYYNFKSDFIFTKGIQNKIYFPRFNEDIKIYENNLLPQPKNSIHSTISFNLKTIKSRYINALITNKTDVPADAQILIDIRNEIITNNLSYLYISIASCIEYFIGETLVN